MAKFHNVAERLEERIRMGDYLLKDFPTDRQLSAEFEVDTRTARKAVSQLIENGLLSRQSNGRPTVGPALGGPTCAVTPKMRRPVEVEVGLRIAFLTVAYPTPHAWRWQRAIKAAVDQRGGLFRPVTYTHLDDPIVSDTLEGFGAAFIGLPASGVTDHFLRTIERSTTPLVFIDADLSDRGHPSVWLASPAMTRQLLDHMTDTGHQRVAFLNTQPHSHVVRQRRELWQQWAGTDRGGRLVDRPVESFGSAIEQAYRVTLDVVRNEGGFDADALLCCTAAAAKGVYRALHECGIEVGRDLAVCACDDGAGEASYLVPSLTSLTDPDPSPYLEVCLDWIERGGRQWHGPMLVQPPSVPLFVGESTDPAHAQQAKAPKP